MEGRVFWISKFSEPFEECQVKRLAEANLTLQNPTPFEPPKSSESLQNFRDPVQLVPYLVGPLLVDEREKKSDKNAFKLHFRDNGQIVSVLGLSQDSAIDFCVDRWGQSPQTPKRIKEEHFVGDDDDEDLYDPVFGYQGPGPIYGKGDDLRQVE